tara:strand:- start:839 stop:3331 length:2493 start_codon:yes stop_codon:yes gene_type:complete
MKVNYNDLARYLLDKKIEIPLFSHLKKITEIDWPYYRELLIDNWLNSKGELDGISNESVSSKISRNISKLNDNSLSKQDHDRSKVKFESGNNLKNGVFEFNDLKIFLNFPDPLEILLTISKKDLKKNVVIDNPSVAKSSISYLNSKRAEQYHPESSNIYHQTPYNEQDLRQILSNGIELFKSIGNYAVAGTLEYYITDLSILLKEWRNDSNKEVLKKIFFNLPKRDHSEWGFVGYENERLGLIEKLSKGNRRLFQVVGQGGSGKSALVNEVCNEIYIKYNTELNINQFIWISSKSDILENAAIKNLSTDSNYSTYKDLITQLFLAINNEDVSDFKDYSTFSLAELETSVKESISGKDGTKRLIIIDNLENISKDNQKRILTFLDENVTTPNYVIITSRYRIIEDFPSVNIELGGLHEKDAVVLFNKLIEYYEVNFKIKSKKDKDEIKYFTKIASYYPLAIKYCIEKAKKNNTSLKTSFESCNSGGSDLHSFIFRDTYTQLNNSQKRLLKTIVVYKNNWGYDIDKHVLKVIFNSIYKADDFESSIENLYQKTLISFVGLSDDDIDVALTALVSSHVEDIMKKHDMDTSKIYNAYEIFQSQQKGSTPIENTNYHLRTSEIQNSIFTKALSNLSNQLAIDTAVKEISKFSNTFYGLGYLEAKSYELTITKSNKEITRKKINDSYLKSIRLKPKTSFFWSDYISFLRKYYPSTINAKLNQSLPLLKSVLFDAIKPENQISFAALILDVLSIIKTKDENSIQIMEYIYQQNINVNYQLSHLQLIKFILSSWLRRPNKMKYLKASLRNDTLKTLLVKNEYETFDKINKQIESLTIK